MKLSKRLVAILIAGQVLIDLALACNAVVNMFWQMRATELLDQFSRLLT